VLARAEAAATSPMGSFVRLRQLQLNQQALQASLDNLPTPIFVKDAQGIYIECNQAFETYLGLPREKIIGATVYQVAPPNLAKIYDQADRQLLTSRGRQVYEAQVRWADGSLRDVTFHKAVWQDTTGRAAGQAGAIFDNTERKRLEQRLREQAETDSLTRLFNRRAFMEQATRSLANARMARHDLALMLIDIDHFKQINDTLGHAAGDAALQHLAATLRGQMRQDDVLARLGGDEFALLVSGHGDMQAVAARLPRLLASRPLEIDGEAVPVTISLGLAVIHPAQHTPASALHIADQALYQAKQQGRNQSHVIDTRARKPMAAGYIDISARTPSACMSLPRPR
jgi:diguanylate cyclase (GGDEF)-like protein/PAS domain S-box-containing protein